MRMKTNTHPFMNQSQINKLNNMIDAIASRYNQKELRAEISEWFETFSREDISSAYTVLTVVQYPGAMERRVLPQEFKNVSAACMDSSYLLSRVIADCGAFSITTEIRNDRFYVTTDNNVKITMVLD